MPRNAPTASAGWTCCAAAALWICGAGACASDAAASDSAAPAAAPGAAPAAEPGARAGASDAQAARIAELEQAIARDRAELRRLVSQQGASEDSAALHSNPELHEIARRLPAMQQELSQLRRARAAAAPAPAPR